MGLSQREIDEIERRQREIAIAQAESRIIELKIAEEKQKKEDELKGEMFLNRFRKSNIRKIQFGIFGTITLFGLSLILLDRFVTNKPLKTGRID